MPHERSYNYYHWSMDKPCTTNDEYGFFNKNALPSIKTTAKAIPGPFDYTRPFSNMGFFPAIADQSRQTVSVQPRPSLRPSKEYHPSSSRNLFDINRGYTMGHIPACKRLVKSDPPAGFKLSRVVSAPTAFDYPTPKGKDMLLWHTLAGTLVHVKNYPPCVRENDYRVRQSVY
jgi:hypothetical protein